MAGKNHPPEGTQEQGYPQQGPPTGGPPPQGHHAGYQQQGYPPQGYQQPPPGYAYPPPQKKSHTLRNVLLGMVLALILIIGGCVALIGGAANEIDKAIDEEAANDRPTTVEVGKKFSHDGYEVAAGWKVGREFGTVTINNINVTNVQNDSLTGDGGRTALLTFRFYKGKQNLAEVECTGKELQEGESSSMDCFSTDEFPTGYKQVKVADFW